MTISLCLDPGNASAPFENLSDTYGRLIKGSRKSAGKDYTLETTARGPPREIAGARFYREKSMVDRPFIAGGL